MMKLSFVQSTVMWALYALVCVLLAISCAFFIWGYFDYGYGVWYQVLDIPEHLNTYAAQNQLKPQFHTLDAATHKQLFSDIVKAVHVDVGRLGTLSYHAPNGLEIQLLHQAEITHLEDVAQLFDQLKKLALGLALLWLPLAFGVLRCGSFHWRQGSLLLALVFLPGILWLLVKGPTQVFYQLHEWIFPPDNPWFFYWEESHMSAMMKAPYLFGAIAVEITLLAMVLTPLLHGVGLFLVRGVAR